MLGAIECFPGITVNLGSGHNLVQILSMQGYPALNIGQGGILFQGSGGLDDLAVENDSSFPMGISGNVTVQGKTAGSALMESGSNADASFSLAANSNASLTVSGNISAAVACTGHASFYTSVGVGRSGSLAIGGSVTLSTVDSDASKGTNVGSSVFDENSGNVVVFGKVSEVASSDLGMAQNFLGTTGVGTISVFGGVTQDATSTSGSSSNQITTQGYVSSPGGNILIAKDVIQQSGGQTVSDSTTETAGNKIASSRGSLTINGSAYQTIDDLSEKSGTVENNLVNCAGSATLSIGATAGGGVSQGGLSNLSITNEVSASAAGTLLDFGTVLQGGVESGATDEVYLSGSGDLGAGFIDQDPNAGSGNVLDKVYTDGTGNLLVGASGINITPHVAGAIGGGSVTNSVYTKSVGVLKTNGQVTITTTNDANVMETATNNVFRAGGLERNTLGGRDHARVIRPAIPEELHFFRWLCCQRRSLGRDDQWLG